MADSICPFCKIASHQTQAEIVYEDDAVIAFNDAHPIAPVHILIIPKIHLDSVNCVSHKHTAILGQLIVIAKVLAVETGVSTSGYRLVINTGRDANQTILHLHLHLIGGRFLPFHFE